MDQNYVTEREYRATVAALLSLYHRTFSHLVALQIHLQRKGVVVATEVDSIMESEFAEANRECQTAIDDLAGVDSEESPADVVELLRRFSGPIQ